MITICYYCIRRCTSSIGLCILLRLNPGPRGEHLTSQLSWIAVWLLVTHVCPVYLVDELVLGVLQSLLIGLNGGSGVCRLLRLNPRAQGEHLTSQLSWAAAWLLVTRVCPVFLVGEFSPCVLWPLMIGLMVVLLTFFWMVSIVLLLWGVEATLGNGYGI